MLPAPPKRPKPDLFYLEHLPEFWQALLDGADLPPLAIDVQVEVTGETPWRYVVTLAHGKITSRAGSIENATATLSLDMDAYRTATRDLWPRAARRLNATVERARTHLRRAFAGVDGAAWLDRLLELPGELELVHRDDAGDTSLTRMTLGHGPGARARILSTDADVSLLVDGKSSLVQLLKSRATIEGDAGWVLRLAGRLNPRP